MSDENEYQQEDSAFGKVTISLKLNDNDSELSPMSFAVQEFDSIYQLYPKVKLNVSDYEGVLNEYLAFVDGTKVEISFGESDDSLKKCSFVVAKNAVPQQKTSSNGTGGDFEVELIHEYFIKQYKKSKAYQNNISDIIKSLVNEYEFDSIDIESTLNSGMWYQPYVNDAEFIMNYLSPFAFSNSSENTPFFTFIDSNNNFHFKSFNMMFNGKAIHELTYDTENVIANPYGLSSVNFSQLELSKLRPWLNTSYYNYDNNGNYVYDNDKLMDYMKTTKGKFPIIGNSDNPTNIISLYDYDIEQDDTENNNKGYKINLHKESILPDKIIINTVLNKNLVCGNIITINLPSVESNQTDEKSLRNSGNYLIESSYHIWDGHNARTMLICSKQNINITNEYRIKELLLS